MALRRTTKSKLYRYTVYAVLIAVAVWLIVSTDWARICLLYTSPSPRDLSTSRMPSSA